MSDPQRLRFRHAVELLEAEEDVARLDVAMEDRLVQAIRTDLTRQRARRRIWGGATAALALAACLALFVSLRRDEGSIPDYLAEIPGDAQNLGTGAPLPAATRLAEDSVLSVELRPKDRFRGQVVVRAFLWHDGTLSAWPVELSSSRHGVFRLQAPISELPQLRVGHLDLVFAIGPAGGIAMPSVDQISAMLQHKSSARLKGWQVLRRPLEIVPRPR